MSSLRIFAGRVLALALALSPVSTNATPLAALVRDHARQHDFHGVVLVKHGDDVLLREGFGLADRAFAVPATPDTRYRVASITKLFTAALVLGLVDEGKIDLAAPVSGYLPDYPSGSIPVRTLLNHTSGLPNPDAGMSFEKAVAEGIELYQVPHDTAALLRDHASGPPTHPPGSHFDYNNADYFVLGKVIEAAAGKPYDVALRERLLAPLALADTGLLRQRDIVARLAPTYLRPGPGQPFINDLPFLYENCYAACGMYSTVDDLARFAGALYGGTLLKPDTLAAMLAPGLDDYGLGLWVWDQTGEPRPFRAAVRFGGIMGANAVLYRVLSDDLTVVILANTNATDMGEFADRVARAALRVTPPAPKRPGG